MLLPVFMFVILIFRPQARRPDPSTGGLDGRAHHSADSFKTRPPAVIPLVPSRRQDWTVNHVAYPLVPALATVAAMMRTPIAHIIVFIQGIPPCLIDHRCDLLGLNRL
jgi:hypothetical protein